MVIAVLLWQRQRGAQAASRSLPRRREE